MNIEAILTRAFSNIQDAIYWVNRLNATDNNYQVVSYNAHFWQIVNTKGETPKT